MKKRAIFCFFLVFCSSLFLCGGDGVGAEKTKITIGRMIATEMMVTFDIPIAKGYFEQEGLLLEQKQFINGPTLMMSMANGELDVGCGVAITPALQSLAQGVDGIIVFSESKYNSPVVAGGHIKTFKDLDGKVVGTPGLGTVHNTYLNMAAQKYGIKFKKAIHAKITDLPVFLEKGEIDGFEGWEWIAAGTVTGVKGAHYVLRYPVINNAEMAVDVFNGKFYREHPELVKKFTRAYLRGMKYFTENPAEVITFLAKRIDRPETVAKMALESCKQDQPELDMPSVRILAQDAIETQKIKKELVPDLDKFLAKYIDQRIMLEVKKEIGLK